jgi:hypothetical protein
MIFSDPSCQNQSIKYSKKSVCKIFKESKDNNPSQFKNKTKVSIVLFNSHNKSHINYSHKQLKFSNFRLVFKNNFNK